MSNLLHALINNRVTVSFALLIILIFVIIPGAMILDWRTNPNSQGAALSISTIIIIISFSLITIGWHIGSSFLKKDLIEKAQIKDDDFINQYKGGFEAFADLNTLGFAKYIGYKRLKILFACIALALGFIILLISLVAFINFEFLISMSEKDLIVPIFLPCYLLAAILSYPIVRKKLK